jgi:hypothetical protein
VLASALVRIALNWSAPGPWIFVDELIYSSLGRTSLSGFTIRGAPISGYGTVYPLVLAPAYYLFDNLVVANQAVKVTNALVMSTVAVPVYVMGRQLLRRRWALAAAGVVVCIPGMSYTSVVMTENAFFPIAGFAFMCMLLALLRRQFWWQLAVFPLIFLAFETRAQGAVLLAIYAVALVSVVTTDVIAASTGNRRAVLRADLRRFGVSLGILVAGVLGTLAFLASAGRSPSSLLGAYAITAEATERYQWRPVLSWFLMHVSELDLWLGIVPFVALMMLVGVAVRERDNRDVRVFACLAVPAILIFGVLVAAFVVFSNVGRIEERNLFYVGVFPLLALCWWLDVGVPRPARWFAISLAVACALPLAIPFGALINQTAASDTFGIYLPWAIQNRLLDVTLTTYAITAGIVLIAIVTTVARGHARFVLLAAVVGYFLLTNAAVQVKTDKASAGAVQQGIGGQRDWIDSALGSGADVTVMYSGALEPLRVWENEFFNRSIKGVYAMGIPVPDGLPQLVVNPDASGNVVDLDGRQVSAPYVLVHDSTTVAGEVVVANPNAHLSVVRVSAPLRLTQQTIGLFDDGWTSGQVVFREYGCRAGFVRTEVALDGFLHSDPVMVTPKAGEKVLPAVSVPVDGTPVEITVPVAPTSTRLCEVTYDISPLAIPKDVLGSSDTRSLGVLMTQPVFTAG